MAPYSSNPENDMAIGRLLTNDVENGDVVMTMTIFLKA